MSLYTDKPGHHTRTARSSNRPLEPNEKAGNLEKAKIPLTESKQVDQCKNMLIWVARKVVGFFWTDGDHRVDRKVPGDFPRRSGQV